MYKIEKMTPEQLEEIASELLDYSHWLRWVKIGYKLYGDKLYKIDLSSEGVYNDEGGTAFYLHSISGYDKNDDYIEIPHKFYVEQNKGVNYNDNDLGGEILKYDLLHDWLDNETETELSPDRDWILFVDEPPSTDKFYAYMESLACKDGVE